MNKVDINKGWYWREVSFENSLPAAFMSFAIPSFFKMIPIQRRLQDVSFHSLKSHRYFQLVYLNRGITLILK